MKAFAIIIAAFLLTACSPTVTNGHIQRAVEACKDSGGIAELDILTFFGAFDLTKFYAVECVDGTYKNIGKVAYK